MRERKSKLWVEKTKENLVNAGYREDSISYHRRTTFSGEDVYDIIDDNVIEFLTNSQSGWASCTIDYGTNKSTVEWEWEDLDDEELDDEGEKHFKDIKSLRLFIDRYFFYGYKIIPDEDDIKIMGSPELVVDFLNDLKKKLEDELESWDLYITNACNEWIDSVVDYYSSFISDREQSLEDVIDEILAATDKAKEKHAFKWPSTNEAMNIIEKAFKNYSDYFIYITEECGLSRRPDDCFKAKWFYDIRPIIIDFMKNYVKK